MGSPVDRRNGIRMPTDDHTPGTGDSTDRNGTEANDGSTGSFPTRRSLLRATAAGVAGTVLAGCSGTREERFEAAPVSLTPAAGQYGFRLDQARAVETTREPNVAGQTVRVTIVSHLAAYGNAEQAGRNGVSLVERPPSVGLASTPSAEVLDQQANPIADQSLGELLTSDVGRQFVQQLDVDASGWQQGPMEMETRQVTMLDTSTAAKTFLGVTNEGDLVLINAARVEVDGDIVLAGDARSRSYQGDGDLAGAVEASVLEEAAAAFADQVAPHVVLGEPRELTGEDEGDSEGQSGDLRTFEVVQNGLNGEEADRLRNAMIERFNADPELFEYDQGAFEYFDPENFKHVPRTEVPADEVGLEMPDEAEERPDTFPAIDRAAIDEMPDPPNQDAAASDFMAALEEAELAPNSRFQGGSGPDTIHVAVSTHQSPVELFDADGNKQVEQPIETTVSVRTAIDGHELVGGGSKIHATFATVDGRPTLTSLRYTHPTLTPGSGSAINAVSFEEVAPTEEYAEELPWAPGEPDLNGDLVYPVPTPEAPLGEGIGEGEYQPSTLVPQYQIQGTVDAGGEIGEIDLMGRFVRATQPGELAPQVSIDASADGSEVVGEVSVDGGQPPYRVQWSSEDGVPAPDGAEQARIQLRPRESIDQTEVAVSVVDANGVSATARTTVDVSVEGSAPDPVIPTGPSARGAAAPADSREATVGGVPDFGFEGSNWGVSFDNGFGFVKRMRAGPLNEQFSYQGKWAWERDYRDPSGPTAWDENYGDNADFQFYCGHGCPSGFSFKDSDHEDGFFHYSEGNRDWGDFDAEWTALYSCSVMKPDLDASNPSGPCGQCDGKSVVNRWGDNFDGLHILMGFQALAYTWIGYQRFSSKFGSYLLWGNQIHKAWFRAIKNHQPNSNPPDGLTGRGRVIAPIGPNNVTGFHDRIWGRGRVAPDIPSGQIRGWCAVPGG